MGKIGGVVRKKAISKETAEETIRYLRTRTGRHPEILHNYKGRLFSSLASFLNDGHEKTNDS